MSVYYVQALLFFGIAAAYSGIHLVVTYYHGHHHQYDVLRKMYRKRFHQKLSWRKYRYNLWFAWLVFLVSITVEATLIMVKLLKM